MRAVKSENEINVIREACKINERVLIDLLKSLRIGMTEQETVGIICESLYRNGAEAEALPSYVFGGIRTRGAIGRPTQHKLKKNELIQLNFGARYEGYASALGRPVVIGKMKPAMKRHVQFGLDIHRKTYDWIKEGVKANTVAENYLHYFKEHGHETNYLYGPCHGCGIIEVEKPWMERSSNYSLCSNMTFMADTFFLSEEYGFRWEDGFRVLPEGVECFSDRYLEIIEL